jgi:hypothetical protein
MFTEIIADFENHMETNIYIRRSHHRTITAQWLLCVTLAAQYVWFEVLTALISLYGMHWMVFQMESGYCLWGMNWLSASPCQVCGDQSGAGTGFSPKTSVFPVSIIPPSLPSYLPLKLHSPEGQTGEAWERSNKEVIFRISWSIGQKSAYLNIIFVEMF